MRGVTSHTIVLTSLFALSSCGGLAQYDVPICDSDDPTCEVDSDDQSSDNLDPESDCTDGQDNNNNGMTDCDDPGCLSFCDADGDGYISTAYGGDDCDDEKARSYPGADEICDQLDNNCDGSVDGDGDGDGSLACDDCDTLDATIYPGATEICDDGIDSNCDGEDCLEDWVEDFETGSLGAHWSAGGNQPWTVQSQYTYEGSSAAASGTIVDLQSSSMSVTVDFSAPGTLSFWHRGSTESGWDELHIYMDGIDQQQWGGVWDWTQQVYNINAGLHTITWTYSKDGSLSSGSDKVWIDLIEVTNGTVQ